MSIDIVQLFTDWPLLLPKLVWVTSAKVMVWVYAFDRVCTNKDPDPKFLSNILHQKSASSGMFLPLEREMDSKNAPFESDPNFILALH